jgi:hypothetical protein
MDRSNVFYECKTTSTFERIVKNNNVVVKEDVPSLADLAATYSSKP